jgi:hypothetical protein
MTDCFEMRADEITAPFLSSGGERKIMNHFVANFSSCGFAESYGR